MPGDGEGMASGDQPDLAALVAGLSEGDKDKLRMLLLGTRPKERAEPGGENKGPVASSGDSQGNISGSENSEGAQGRDTLGRLDETRVPTLPKFSGGKDKNETSFRLWSFEVNNLLATHGEQTVSRAIHRSVRGAAAEVLMHLGTGATVQQILRKYEQVFGSVVSKEKLLSEFYTAHQKATESIAEWACRLEDLLSHSQLDITSQREEMIKSRFFYGLATESVRNAIRHRFESGTFEQLVVKAREAEEENAKATKAISKAQVEDPVMKKLEEIAKDLATLKVKTEGWERRLSQVEGHRQHQPASFQRSTSSCTTSADQRREVKCYHCKKVGHIKRNCPELVKENQSAG